MYTQTTSCLKRNCHISAQNKFWIKVGVPVKKVSLLNVLYVKFYKLKSLIQALLHSPETSVQNRFLF